MQKQYNLDKILKFGPEKQVFNKYGAQRVRCAKPNKEFSALYKKHKEELKDIGIRFTKVKDEWVVMHWQKGIINEEEIEASKAMDCDKEFIAPEGLSYMPYQKAGIDYVLKHPNCLIGDEMGLGKTVEAIGVLNNSGAKTALIICPKVLLGNWKKELNKWLVNKDLTVAACCEKYEEADIQVLNFESLKKYEKQLSGKVFDYVFVDEAHYIKNYKAQRSKYAKKYKGTMGTVRMSGTPFENRPTELWNVIEDLDKKTFGNYMAYTKRYCAGHYTQFGYDDKGASNIDELYSLLRSTIMIRRLKKDVLKDLPAKQRQIIYLTTTKEQLKLINEELELNVNYNDLFKDPRFNEMMAIKHQIALSKVKQVKEYIDSVYEAEPNKKMVLACMHHDVEETLMGLLKKYKPLLINGNTPAEERTKNEELFQKCDEHKIIIIGMKAAGVGITLTAADTMLFVEENYVPGVMCQTEDRIHRIGQENSVLIQHLILDKSMEEKILDIVFKKQEVIEKALDKPQDTNKTPKSPRKQEKGLILTVELTDREYALEKELEDEKGVSVEQKRLIKEALKILAGSDNDRAQLRNGVGFNKFDSGFGNQLAGYQYLSDKQAIAAKNMLKKYWRQLPEDLSKELFQL